jgi:hypothetical protein
VAQNKLELVAEPGKPMIVPRRVVAELLVRLLSGTPAEVAP